MNKALLITAFVLPVLFAGCSNMVSVEQKLGTAQTDHQPLTAAQSQHLADVKDTIYRQYQQYKNTGYVYGGTSANGLDCSGLVYITYRNQLGVNVPRTTAKQIYSGNAVARNQLRPGDLVFFKTSIKSRHVGIYIEDNKFLHVSTSQGVMISRLDDAYWQPRFLQARRIID